MLLKLTKSAYGAHSSTVVTHKHGIQASKKSHLLNLGRGRSHEKFRFSVCGISKLYSYPVILIFLNNLVALNKKYYFC